MRDSSSLFFLQASCSPVRRSSTMMRAKTGLDPARLAQIPVRMKQFVDKGTAAGIVTLVARHGKVAALDAVGYTDLETRQPIKADAIFQIHSMTKPIVAMAAMILAEEGKLSIGDPVEKYLPEFRGQWVVESQGPGTMTLRRPARPVTLRDLMTHTSGMSLNPPEGIKELHGALHKTLAEVVLVESQQPLEFDPGTKWQYSNNGIAALARIIEVVSGMPFEKFLEARIFQPLGMKDTYIFPPKEKHHRMPTAYILKERQASEVHGGSVGRRRDEVPGGCEVLASRRGALLHSQRSLFALSDDAEQRAGQRRSTSLICVGGSDDACPYRRPRHQPARSRLGTGLVCHQGRRRVRYRYSRLGVTAMAGVMGLTAFIDPEKDLIGIFMIHREGGSDERRPSWQWPSRQSSNRSASAQD